jgi:hypothetical protein
MTNFSDKLDWVYVCQYQKLSEEFMTNFSDKLYWGYLSYTNKVSSNFDKFVLKENNWLYISEEKKEKKVCEIYKIEEIEGKKYVECYKAVNEDYSSIYKKNSFTYDKLNEEYETVCNYNELIHNSNGFGCWTIEKAKEYGNIYGNIHFKLIKCIVPLDSICMLENGKIRSCKLIVIEFL